MVRGILCIRRHLKDHCRLDYPGGFHQLFGIQTDDHHTIYRRLTHCSRNGTELYNRTDFELIRICENKKMTESIIDLIDYKR